jgi:hypothetical protein
MHLVNLRLVPDQVLSPSRSSTDGVDVNNCLGGRRSDVPTRSSSRFNNAQGSLHPRNHHKRRSHPTLNRSSRWSGCTRIISKRLPHNCKVRRSRAGWRSRGTQVILRRHCRPAREHHISTRIQQDQVSKILPCRDQNSKLRPKNPRLNRRRHLCLRGSSSSLRLQTPSEGILRRLLHQLPLPLSTRTLRPPCRSILGDRQLLDSFVLLLLFLLLLFFRFDLP